MGVILRDGLFPMSFEQKRGPDAVPLRRYDLLPVSQGDLPFTIFLIVGNKAHISASIYYSSPSYTNPG